MSEIANSLFEKLKVVLQLEKLDREPVSAALGLEIFKTEEASSEYFDYCFGSGIMGQVELRVPLPAAAPKDGILIISLSQPFDAAEVPAELGEPEFSVAGPEVPGAPTYYTYHPPREELTFEVQQDQVVKVIIDRLEKSKG